MNILNAFNMELKIISILVFVHTLTEIKSAKILAVFPMPSLSHQVVFRPITQELARRGHEVTVITPDPAFPKGGAPQNMKEINLHDISYQAWHNFTLGSYKVNGIPMSFKDVRLVSSVLAHIFEVQTQSSEIQKLLMNKKNKFDLVLIEALFRPAIVYSYIFNAPAILVSSLGVLLNNDKILGLYTHPLLFPSILQTRIYDLTLAEKFRELYMYYSIEYANYLNEINDDRVLKENFGPSVPPLSDLYNNIEMLFINIHPIWADNQPAPPTVVYIGGIHHKPEKELSQNLKTYLDASEHGVIYLSFGTNVLAEMIPSETIEIIIKVLSGLPYDVLWKWDKDELPGQSKNIRLSKWYPQSDLLKHSKVKLFITQAGLQSTDEAILAGVPLVAIPMHWDQWYNAEKYVKLGIGMKLDINTLTAEVFRNAVENVINDESYRQNVAKLRDFMGCQLETPLDRAVWWVENVIRHGGVKYLRPPSANISYAQYFEFQLLFILLLGILIISAAIIVVTLHIYRKITSFLKDRIKFKIN